MRGMKFQALGRMRSGEMNGLEKEYDNHLKTRLMAGDILWYKFEGVRFVIAPGCSYTPDFFVMRSNGVLEVHECKGFWTDDAKVKTKVAASMFPFEFFIVKKVAKKRGGGFSVESDF